jgi:hypothetical protein
VRLAAINAAFYVCQLSGVRSGKNCREMNGGPSSQQMASVINFMQDIAA